MKEFRSSAICLYIYIEIDRYTDGDRYGWTASERARARQRDTRNLLT